MSTIPLLDFTGHRWELTSNNPEVYLMLTTMRNAPAVWRLVPAANIVCPPVGQLPRPGEPLTALQRLRPFQLMVVTDRSVILLGSGRLFGRANRGNEIVTMLKPCSETPPPHSFPWRWRCPLPRPAGHHPALGRPHAARPLQFRSLPADGGRLPGDDPPRPRGEHVGTWRRVHCTELMINIRIQ